MRAIRSGRSRARISNSVPVLLDSLQFIGESLNAATTGEVLVINPASWKVEYRGAIDGVAPALDAVMSGEPVPRSSRPVGGCKVSLPETARRAAHAQISYTSTIAPILKDNCVTCHREGGIGPWQMGATKCSRLCTDDP